MHVSENFQELLRGRVIDQLARCYPTDAEARALLRAAGVELSTIPPMNHSPTQYWSEACHRVLAGAGEMHRIIARAAIEFRENEIFTGWPSALLPVEPDPAASQPDKAYDDWRHARSLDRILQWTKIEKVARSDRSTLILLHGQREQALFQLIQRCRTGGLTDTLRVVEVPFRDDGQDRGPLSAGVWIRDVRHQIATSLGAEDVTASRRQHTVLAAVEAPYPRRHTDKARITELAVRHLPPLLAEPGALPLVVVLVIERDGPDNDFVESLCDALRPALQAQSLRFFDLSVDFPPWQEVGVFLDENEVPSDVRSEIEERYLEIREAGGSFVKLAELIEEAFNRIN